MKTNIYCCGMYRSGSTVIYNILQKLIEHHNLQVQLYKVHQEWNRDRVDPSFSIYSYRDIRDVCISFMQKDKMTFESFKIHNWDIVEFCKKMINYDQLVKHYKKDDAKVLILKYEEDVIGNDVVPLCIKISDFLELPNTTCCDIGKQFSLKVVKKYCDTLKTLDRKSGFWPGHAHDGKSGKYKEILTSTQLLHLYKNTDLKNG